MVVYKFGGALGRSKKGLEALVKIVREAARSEGAKARRSKRSGAVHGIVLVTSAIGHTTRQLARAAELAEDGRLPEAEDTLGRVVSQHEQLAVSLGLEDEEDLFDQLDSLSQEAALLLEGIAIVREVSPRTRDAVLACGERFAIALIEALLRHRELPVRFIDAREVMITDENFGYAAPQIEEIGRRVHKLIVPHLRRSHIVLVQGFVGATRDGIATTMGSESSDLTATILGSVLDAKEVVIWKTLPGLYTADPELVKNPKLIRSLSFEEAEELGRRGARVLFPTFAHPLVMTGGSTLVRIATPFGKATHHTTLQRELRRSRSSRTELAIAVEQKLVPITIRNGEMHDTPQARRAELRAQQALARLTLLWRSQEETTGLVKREDRRTILRDLAAAGYTITEGPAQSAIALILRTKDGSGDAQALAAMARSLRSFHTHAILPAGRSLIALVDDSEALPALKKLHHDLFET